MVSKFAVIQHLCLKFCGDIINFMAIQRRIFVQSSVNALTLCLGIYFISVELFKSEKESVRSEGREKDRSRERKRKKERKIASENEKVLKIGYEQNHELFIIPMVEKPM